MAQLRTGGAKPAIVNSLALALSSGLNFVALFIWTRLLTPAEYGRYTLVLATVLLINATIFEWLRQVGARTLFDPQSSTSVSVVRGNALSAIYTIVALLFVTAIGILWSLDVPVAGLTSGWWPTIGVFVLAEMALAISNTISRVRFNPWQYFRSVVGRAVLAILLGLLFVLEFGYAEQGIIAGVIIAEITVVFASGALDRFWRTIHPLRARKTEMVTQLSLGYPLILSCMLSYAFNAADRYLISATLGNSAVGLYSAPVDLLQKTLVFVMLAINLTSYPSIVREYETHGQDSARRMLEQNFVIQFGLGLPAVLIFIALAPGVSHLLLGPAFRAEGELLLPFIGVAALLRSLISFHLTIALQLSKRMKLTIVAPAVGLALLVPTGLISMHLFGLIGMAMAAMISQIGSYAVAATLARRVFPFALVNGDLLKILLAGAAMVLVMLPFRYQPAILSTLTALVIGGLVYLIMLVVLRLQLAVQIQRYLVKRLRRGD